jgi:hypothetical protein
MRRGGFEKELIHNMEQELKKMVFKTIEDHLPLKEFETWLYDQEDLANQMKEDLIIELFTFNYNQNGAKYAFKNTFLNYFDKEEFMLWKVKTNLQDLIDGRETRDQILNDFYWIEYDEVPCIQGLGYYMYELEDADYYRMGKKSVIESLKKEATELLQEILTEEGKNSEFKISMFKRVPRLVFSAEVTNPNNSKGWWKFWK